jgi:hypothetical protein
MPLTVNACRIMAGWGGGGGVSVNVVVGLLSCLSTVVQELLHSEEREVGKLYRML